MLSINKNLCLGSATKVTGYIYKGHRKNMVILLFVARCSVQHCWTCSWLKPHIFHFPLFSPLKQRLFWKVLWHRGGCALWSVLLSIGIEPRLFLEVCG